LHVLATPFAKLKVFLRATTRPSQRSPHEAVSDLRYCSGLRTHRFGSWRPGHIHSWRKNSTAPAHAFALLVRQPPMLVASYRAQLGDVGTVFNSPPHVLAFQPTTPKQHRNSFNECTTHSPIVKTSLHETPALRVGLVLHIIPPVTLRSVMLL